MISRRNFFTITLIMLVLLFMFQAPEVVKEQMNNYGVNTYAQTQESSMNAGSAPSAVQISKKSTGRYIVYIGNTRDHAVGSTVKQWCSYSKRYLEAFEKLRMYEFHATERPEAVIIDSAYMDVERDTKVVSDLTKRGVHVIFCGLPELKELKGNMELRSLMGIRGVLFDEIRVQGIHLFDGFLLGGEKIYQLDDTMEESQQDLELTIPWCQIASGTKKYVVGMLGDDVKNEELPAIVWRNSVGKARVFVVCGDYLIGNSGLGFLEAMLYETQSYALYPVVNAQNLVVLNYPTTASENEDTMIKLYSRPLEAVYRDLVWPGLSVTSEKSGNKLTCMLSPQQDYQDDLEPEPETLIYYMKLLQERKGEAGISSIMKNGNGLSDKLKQDRAFLQKQLPDYQFLSYYQGVLSEKQLSRALKNDLLKDVRTVFADYDESKPLISYLSKNITRQRATSDGYSHTFSEDIRMNSIQTALGYSSIVIDLDKVAYPESEEDSWEKLYDQFSSIVNTYWKAYEKMSATTLAESDARIRRFLALDYTQVQSENEISVSLENFEEEAFFILRLQGEQIKEMQGAEYEVLDENIYLITAHQDQITIKLREGINRAFFN